MKRLSRPPAKPRGTRTAWITAAALVLGMTAASTLRAQTTLYYTGGTGNWTTATTTTDWSASATGTPTTYWVNGDTARIGDTSKGTLTLTTAIMAQELDIDNITGSAIGGTLALTLTSGNINSNFLSGNTAASLSTTITAPLAGTNINISATGTSGSSTGFGNNTITLSGANTFTGNLNLGAAASGPAGAGINRVNITALAALPSTATVNFNNTNTSFAVTGGTLTLPNNFVINPGSSTYTAGAFETYIGATSGNGLTVNGTISGNGDVTYAAGINGGAGVVLLNSANTYAGASVLAISQSGIVRLGINNALPTTTPVTFGDGSTTTSGGNIVATFFGALDLNGKTQTVASLSTNLAVVPPNGTVSTTAYGVATGVINTSSTQAALTISGSATTTYNSIIGVPTNTTVSGANSNISLTLAATNTGTQILGGANSYTGTTQIGGGTLQLGTTAANNVNGSVNGSINGSLLVQVGVAGTTTTNVGALTLNNASALADAGTLSMVHGTTLNLNAAASTSEAVGALVLDGTTEPAGTYTASQLMGLDSAITFTSLNGETLTVVPEPATVFGGILLVGALGWSQRRRLGGLAGQLRHACTA